MFTTELDSYLSSKNFILTYQELQDIQKSTSQLTRTILRKSDNTYDYYTIGTSENINFDVLVKSV